MVAVCHVEISPLGVGFAAFGKLFRIVVQVLVIGGGVERAAVMNRNVRISASSAGNALRMWMAFKSLSAEDMPLVQSVLPYATLTA